MIVQYNRIPFNLKNKACILLINPGPKSSGPRPRAKPVDLFTKATDKNKFSKSSAKCSAECKTFISVEMLSKSF